MAKKKERTKMKFCELTHQEVYADGEKIAKVEDVIVDTEEWGVTHLDYEKKC